jgi:hypothetical protein
MRDHFLPVLPPAPHKRIDWRDLALFVLVLSVTGQALRPSAAQEAHDDRAVLHEIQLRTLEREQDRLAVLVEVIRSSNQEACTR